MFECPVVRRDQLAEQLVVCTQDFEQLFRAAVSAKVVKPRRSQKRQEI